MAESALREPRSDNTYAWLQLVVLGMASVAARAETILKDILGPDAGFRPGQIEAIESACLPGARVLIVQKTGWGKSLVYFFTLKLLREEGSGPGLLVSPLLSLMRNQIEMAERGGVRAVTLNSSNRDEWDAVEERLRRSECDLLMVAPERLGA